MLKTRIITAIVLLAVLLPVLYWANPTAFAVVVTLFFGAAIWEGFRLFNPGSPMALLISLAWTAAFAYAFFFAVQAQSLFWFAISVLVWLLRLAPSLKIGLPPLASGGNTLLSLTYAAAIVACFAAIVALFRHSPLYLLSVMALVWIADIGAYCAGKAFGKRKLAPMISPGKSWEGAIGGGVAVLLLATLSVLSGTLFADTFAANVQKRLGWAALFAILIVITAASVVGDLFESQLKRRAGVKDSSKLLPGHGGVLDRIDALIPVLPLAALIDTWL
ncbi:phosphatidate cytidylyltransferase [Massilia psychrophila]|jgi:phosphatidate cytidylyltransferase|uniref:Phosphatidate cytidylyltransferase n=1 Tax=Massilia psychrophila TaxID=1603353 RepID=A0A2G8T0L4_9BURK|nr:phosphatidate cytidylyltransferase [Massilia psychrophila]PIL39607.1 phosphatidate cytidylyltransferase [Massilia psychrophila]GGE74275.1 phosphatidate cytidylyltransferase [Massilia psychrophila]